MALPSLAPLITSGGTSLERTAVERLTKAGLDKLTARLTERIGDPRALAASRGPYSMRRTVAHAIRGIEAYLHLAIHEPTHPHLASARAQAEELWTVLERVTMLLDFPPAPIGGPHPCNKRKDLPVTLASPSNPASSPRATLTTARIGQVLVMRLAGELDMDSASVLTDAPTEEDICGIVFDLSRLEFCDSTGLNALLRLRIDAESRDISVLLAATSPQLTRLLQITGADQIFGMHANIEDAIAALTPG